MTSDNMINGGLLAAVTLGSNSFNLLLAKPNPQGIPQIVAKHKRKVRLADGMTAQGALGDEAFARGLECLSWFGDILRSAEIAGVEVLATAALRYANNGDAFCQQALPLLGYPIEVISGDREAELIYQGMRACSQVDGSALVIDIGGASTELVVGDETSIGFKHSFELGCVSYNQQFLSQGCLSASFDSIHQAVTKALAPQMEKLLAQPWQHCLGVSGTVRSLFELKESGWLPQGLVTRAELQEVKRQLCHDPKPIFASLDAERRPTFVAGVAILLALFELLHIDGLDLAGGALREGVLVQLQANCC